MAAAQVVRNRGWELISGLGHSLEVKQTVCGLDAAGTGGNVSLAGTGHRCKTQEVILGNYRPFRAVRMSISSFFNNAV